MGHVAQLVEHLIRFTLVDYTRYLISQEKEMFAVIWNIPACDPIGRSTIEVRRILYDTIDKAETQAESLTRQDSSRATDIQIHELETKRKWIVEKVPQISLKEVV